jgi:DNA-binding protein H-NS
MKHSEFEKMDVNELWRFHEWLSSILEKRLKNEILKFERGLDDLKRKSGDSPADLPRRRPYPKVDPKFQNPTNSSETWSGRGKQPRWVSELLAAGRTIDQLRILEAAS